MTNNKTCTDIGWLNYKSKLLSLYEASFLIWQRETYHVVELWPKPSEAWFLTWKSTCQCLAGSSICSHANFFHCMSDHVIKAFVALLSLWHTKTRPWSQSAYVQLLSKAIPAHGWTSGSCRELQSRRLNTFDTIRCCVSQSTMSGKYFLLSRNFCLSLGPYHCGPCTFENITPADAVLSPEADDM